MLNRVGRGVTIVLPDMWVQIGAEAKGTGYVYIPASIPEQFWPRCDYSQVNGQIGFPMEVRNKGSQMGCFAIQCNGAMVISPGFCGNTGVFGNERDFIYGWFGTGFQYIAAI